MNETYKLLVDVFSVTDTIKAGAKVVTFDMDKPRWGTEYVTISDGKAMIGGVHMDKLARIEAVLPSGGWT